MAAKNNYISVTALSAGRFVPSAQFGIRQFIKPLLDYNIKVHESIPVLSKYAAFPSSLMRKNRVLRACGGAVMRTLKLASRMPGVIRSYSSDITWLSRELIPQAVTFEPILKRPLVLNIDDAIWLSSPDEQASVSPKREKAGAVAKRLAAISDIVVAGNSFLAEWFEPYARQVRIIPLAVDTGVFSPRQKGENSNEKAFTLGWIGTVSNYKYLESVFDPLCVFLSRHPQARLLVVSEKNPLFIKQNKNAQIIFCHWSLQGEVDLIRSMDVGLMPLDLTDWSRGKCALKLKQYLACGVPVIATPVGENAEILGKHKVGICAKTKQDWYDACCAFYARPQEARQCGDAGTRLVEACYSVRCRAGDWSSVFREIKEQQG